MTRKTEAKEIFEEGHKDNKLLLTNYYHAY